jgi:hypothetical protein
MYELESIAVILSIVFWIPLVYASYIQHRSKQVQTAESLSKRVESVFSEKLRPDPLLSLTTEVLPSYHDRPWRPFRWPYHQTMSIFKLDINHWLDMDKYYKRYINEKQLMFQEHVDETISWLDDSQDACEELLDVVVYHLTTRYPKLFEEVRNEKGTFVHNLILDRFVPVSKPYVKHPLYLISELAKEDFYVVKKRADGLHYLVAAAVPFPGGSFNIKDKMGKHLDVIHEGVPYYSEKLQASMERWFGKLKVEDPVERATYDITWDHGLFTNKLYESDDNEIELKEPIPYEKFNVRIERQTLRRLPKSQAIIFTNHPIFYSFEEMKDEPMIPSIIRKHMEEAPQAIAVYKSFDKIKGLLLPYIKRLEERQLELGIISEGDPVRTRSTYPFADWIGSSSAVDGWSNSFGSNNLSNSYTSN